ncbi:PREDICTED: uncharacterized protein LOC104802729 [Tarenaya hassleriana]|uniref:uncharacterized protein LOC104802729 n=1 Tax=Tarenaya hassleriana TaxID=28532 RepID=UPI00053C3BD5|nr:PREDICTED: uncharacterized protein LOC104802729 [Tarenaya hassleriana]XP_010524768.1 PREDICTED: uncharacterized protein LOC104802729 [Tarenaya hassleriana]XP_010524769.1 PREDICTED: uncharacterized protein LOC104802729 [Tarenaya hassleriana]
MSINKDEALRAKDMAEGLMRKADFSGARKLVLRAQKLDSSLENISHMIMVCDVHCAAAEKMFGNEMNWYDILQVERKADVVTIKKQYKKLALLLHPDKNKLPGAEAAFKLIGEAQRILLDKDKRSLFDMKLNSVNRPAPAPSYFPQQVPRYYTQPVVQTNHNTWSNFAGSRSRNFWTSCPFCRTRYEYARVHINKLVNCQSCTKVFTSLEIPCQGAPRAKSSVQTNFSFPQQKNVPTQGMSQATYGFPQQQDVPNQNPFSAGQNNPQTSSSHCPEKDGVPVKVGAGNISGKRKKIVESSESSDCESSSESEEDIIIDETGDVTAGQGLGSVGGQQPRRSVRSKRRVSYNENVSDDDDNIVEQNQEGSNKNGDAKEAEESGIRKQSDCSSNGTLPNGKNRNKKSTEKENGQVGASGVSSEDSEVKINSVSHDSKKDTMSECSEEPKILEYADPDFNDFDELREDRKFVVGQIWAIYDTRDGMPRFYAYIRKVFTSRFKLSITWLETEPDDDNGISLDNADLPIGVGRFVFGNSEITVDRPMFSHVIHCGGIINKKSCRVLPRKGETWALFKNWDINWSTDPGDSPRGFEYEFAEILSDYSKAAGASVALLYKVKGFSSVFCRMAKGGSDTFQVHPLELYRFSHSVPSFRLTGKEREGVPEGSYELDPAALPQNIEEVSVSVPPNASTVQVESRPMSTTQDSWSSDSIMIPKTWFKNFNTDKSKEKFQVDQIWALYGKEDALPKNYAKIQKVERNPEGPELKLQISWLELKSLPENVIEWHDRNMPVCCGTFGLKKDRLDTITDVSAFSHELETESSWERTEFTILPKGGEVWAMYKNWSDRIKVSDLKSSEYDIVEVLDVNEREYGVMTLERLRRFGTVFKRRSEARKTFPISELLRFSHRVPSFRLTRQKSGTLRNCVELDPKALPGSVFSS